MERRHIYCFAPHQDDELTNLGPEICRALSRGHPVHVILCTDGGASSVRRMLCRGDGCRWHEGQHVYNLSAAQFVAARDREFTESCLALGVPAENILISPLRGADGSLSCSQAAEIMLQAMEGYAPARCGVRTIAPMAGSRQNPDHTAVGSAAKDLFREGAFAELRLMEEFIYLPRDLSGFSVIEPTPGEAEKLKKAAACYRRWAPSQGRYAVGYHSVADEFDAFLKRPVGVFSAQ